MKKIILASGSPRRKEILKQIGLKFDIVESNYEEDMTLDMEPAKLAKHLSLGKAQDVAKNYSDAIIIAADTFVTFKHHRLGKPHTPEIARNTLNTINGQTVNVVTGYTIIDSTTNKTISKSITTQVKIKKLTDDEIERYIATGEPLDKAGAVGIQGLGALIIKEITGDFYNVLGLPIFSLAQSLKEFDIYIL